MQKANNLNISVVDVDKLDTNTADLKVAKKTEANTVNEPGMSIIDLAKVE